MFNTCSVSCFSAHLQGICKESKQISPLIQSHCVVHAAQVVQTELRCSWVALSTHLSLRCLCDFCCFSLIIFGVLDFFKMAWSPLQYSL